MEIRAIKPHLTLIALLLATSLVLGFSVDVRIQDVAGVKVELPNQVGSWIGTELRFCQNGACQKVWTLDELNGSDVCPSCGGKVDPMAPAEKALLPADTLLVKKRYRNADGRQIFASVVLSGKERSSIHRPEVCLVGQGSEISGRFVMPVQVPSHGELDTMVVNLLHHRKGPGGQDVQSGSYYAYWFVGNGRETPYHWQRMWWMASDRIFHNRAHRWAYIAVTGNRDLKSEAYREEASDFIRDLYPLMSIKEPGA